MCGRCSAALFGATDPACAPLAAQAPGTFPTVLPDPAPGPLPSPVALSVPELHCHALVPYEQRFLWPGRFYSEFVCDCCGAAVEESTHSGRFFCPLCPEENCTTVLDVRDLCRRCAGAHALLHSAEAHLAQQGRRPPQEQLQQQPSAETAAATQGGGAARFATAWPAIPLLHGVGEPISSPPSTSGGGFPPAYEREQRPRGRVAEVCLWERPAEPPSPRETEGAAPAGSTAAPALTAAPVLGGVRVAFAGGAAQGVELTPSAQSALPARPPTARLLLARGEEVASVAVWARGGEVVCAAVTTTSGRTVACPAAPEARQGAAGAVVRPPPGFAFAGFAGTFEPAAGGSGWRVRSLGVLSAERLEHCDDATADPDAAPEPEAEAEESPSLYSDAESGYLSDSFEPESPPPSPLGIGRVPSLSELGRSLLRRAGDAVQPRESLGGGEDGGGTEYGSTTAGGGGGENGDEDDGALSSSAYDDGISDSLSNLGPPGAARPEPPGRVWGAFGGVSESVRRAAALAAAGHAELASGDGGGWASAAAVERAERAVHDAHTPAALVDRLFAAAAAVSGVSITTTAAAAGQAGGAWGGAALLAQPHNSGASGGEGQQNTQWTPLPSGPIPQSEARQMASHGPFSGSLLSSA